MLVLALWLLLLLLMLTKTPFPELQIYFSAVQLTINAVTNWEC